MEAIKNALDKLMSFLCVVVFIAMVLLTAYQVTSRYVFKSPSSISETLTRYLFVWLIIISATYVFGQRDHICITALKGTFSPKMQKIASIFSECIIIIFSVLIMIYGGGVISKINMLQYDSMLNIPMGLIYSIIPICGVLIIFYSIINIAKYMKE